MYNRHRHHRDHRKRQPEPEPEVVVEEEDEEEEIPIIESIAFEDDMTIPVRKPKSRIVENTTFHTKVIQRTQGEQLVSLTLELHKYDDIFFLLKTDIDNDAFVDICNDYGLHISFAEFLAAVTSMYTNAINDVKATRVSFLYNEKGGGKMSFYDVLDVKAVIIFAIDFETVSQEEQMKEAQRKFDKIYNELQKKNKQLDIFVDEVTKKNYTMMDYLTPKYPKIQQKNGKSPSKSPGKGSAPQSPTTPRSPKLSGNGEAMDTPKSPRSPKPPAALLE